MGVLRAGFNGTVGQSSAQVIDGSLKFDDNYLTRTPGSEGNLKSWTWSAWVKPDRVSGNLQQLFEVKSDGSNYDAIYFTSGQKLEYELYRSSQQAVKITNRVFRDTGWYHLVVVYDAGNSTAADRVRIYVNGERETSFSSSTNPDTTDNSFVNDNGIVHQIGDGQAANQEYDGKMSQVYLIDGQALDASYFGYTDGLTNTWRPKKYEGTFGTNGFYLPLDGNSSIGEDKSGKGNNWTPVNFGGSVALDNPQVSGARPILNTLPGGTIATPGVFGSKENKTFAVTVASVGGGNRYHFDGVDRPNPTLIRGATYTFDQSDSSNSGHPLRFATAADAAGSSQYTDGVTTNGTPGSAGAYTKITVPHNSPNTLHYYCTNHGGMGSSTSQTTDETKADLYAWKNVLALPLVGANSDISNSVNSGSTTKVMTSVGNAAASSDTSNFYNGSFEFDGSGDGITCPSNTDFNFGSGDFTVECWVKQDDTSGFDVFVGKYNGSSSGEFIVGKNGNTPTFYWQDAGGNANINATNFTGNTSSWYHMACVREGDVFTMYINGICENSTTDATTIKTTSEKLSIGIEHDGSSSAFDGYLQDVRIYKGVSKYSGTTIGTQYFVPPTTSPDILPDTPSGVSGGSKLTKVTDGAVSFDGSGDYLTVGSSSDFTMGTGDFTVECFLTKSAQEHKGVFQISDTSGGLKTSALGGTIALGYQSGVWQIYGGGGETTAESSSYPIGVNKWYHLAYVRSSGVSKLYVDGVQVISLSDTTNYNTTYMAIGGYYNTSYLHRGFISNLRVIKGTALYTSNFTPPSSAPLTNVTNTKLLCCQSNTSAVDNDVSPNSGGINDGTVWSNDLTSSNTFASNSGPSIAFDGNTSSFCQPGTNSEFLTFAPSGGISYTTSVEVYTYQSNGVFATVSDGAQSVSWTTLYQGWKTIASGGGTFTSTKLSSGSPGVSDSRPTFAAIRIDGVILLNSIIAKGNVAATNFNPFNTDINTVRGQESGYATLNPLSRYSALVPSDGNLVFTDDDSSNGGDQGIQATIMPTSGKYYWEVTPTALASENYYGVSKQHKLTQTVWTGGAVDAYFYYNNGKKIGGGNGNGGATYGDSFGIGDVIGVAVSWDDGTITFYKNGVSQGVAFSGVDLTGYIPSIYLNTNQTGAGRINFGQKPFKFPPPAGFQPLNLANIRPETVITRPDHYVDVDTYTGTTPNPLERSNFSFAPDFLWFKSRAGARDHVVFDTVRGRAQGLKTNGTDAQAASGATQDLVSFDNDGFTVGEIFRWSSTNRDESLVVWAWKAGGSKNTFNVDDVGYASASDVNMSVGSLNSASYDKSVTWSSTSGMSSPANAFDGSFSTGATVSSSGSPITVTTGSFTASSISFYKNGNNDANLATITINDTSVFSFPLQSTATGWVTVNIGSEVTVTSLKTTWYGAYTLYAVKYDTKLLVDNGTTTQNVPSIAATGASVGTKQGFSIIKYTGNSTANATLPHGLLEAPKFVIIKNLSNTYGWAVLHTDAGTTGTTLDGSPEYYMLQLDSASARNNFSQDTIWNPTSTTVKIDQSGGANWVNNSNSSYISYLWHDVPGLQKFGSYEGNGSADGTFVELGFTPALIIHKDIDQGHNWHIFDNKRDPDNPVHHRLFPSNNSADSTGDNSLDFLSNGFKCRSSNTTSESSTYIYAAWAEAPTVNLFGGQSNAR